MSNKAIVREGDTSSHGGYMITASGKPRVNGLNICLDGDRHYCPKKDHGTTSVSATTHHTSGGKAILRVGDVAGCGAVINSGSPNTTMGE